MRHPNLSAVSVERCSRPKKIWKVTREHTEVNGHFSARYALQVLQWKRIWPSIWKEHIKLLDPRVERLDGDIIKFRFSIFGGTRKETVTEWYVQLLVNEHLGKILWSLIRTIQECYWSSAKKVLERQDSYFNLTDTLIAFPEFSSFPPPYFLLALGWAHAICQNQLCTMVRARDCVYLSDFPPFSVRDPQTSLLPPTPSYYVPEHVNFSRNEVLRHTLELGVGSYVKT